MTRIRFALILFLAVPIAAFAQQFTTPIKINTNGGEGKSPIMHVDRSGTIYISWVKGSGTGSSIYLSKSSDGGKTFSTPILACANANTPSDMQRTAKFAIDTKGWLHFIWIATRVGDQPDIWYMRSIDQGMTWTTPVSLSDDDSKFPQDFPAIACDSSDNVYVSFLDFREPKISGTPSHGRLFVRRSVDGGMSWSNSVKADSMANGIGGTCECCAQHLAVSANGNVFIAFRSSTVNTKNNNTRNIYLARSTDKGNTFQPSLNIQETDWILDACPMKGPNISIDESETAHVVWADGRTNPARLYYTSVPSAATTTPTNTRFDATGSTSANFPDVTTFVNGKYRAIIYQTSNFGMRYLLYRDNIPLVDNRPLPAGESQQVASILFAPDGTRYLAWQDSKLGDPNIYFCQDTSPLESSAVEEQTITLPFSIYPNPLPSESRSITINHQSSIASTLQIIDILGREVFRTQLSNSASQTLELPNVSEGNYICVLNSGNSLQTKILTVR